jgi:hypothetical protein
MTYELKQTQLKNGKFHYQVIDENGNVISDRKSNREYVACTVNGSMYFGRLDLIGKGDHGRFIKDINQSMLLTEDQFYAKYSKDIYNYVYENEMARYQNRLNKLNTIAYKK